MTKKDNIVQINAPKTEKKVIRISSESAQLKHINHRTEGAKENPTRALDLKFTCIVGSDLLKALCGSEEIPSLWNDDGSVKYLGITEFTSRAQLKECTFEFGDLVTAPIHLEGVKVNKFKFNPVGGRGLELTLRVQVAPSDAELIALSHAVLTTAKLNIECELGVIMDDGKEKDPDLLDDQDEE